MQEIRNIKDTIDFVINILRSDKLRAKNLEYFDSNYNSENNKSIISVERYIYYRNIYI